MTNAVADAASRIVGLEAMVRDQGAAIAAAEDQRATAATGVGRRPDGGGGGRFGLDSTHDDLHSQLRDAAARLVALERSADAADRNTVEYRDAASMSIARSDQLSQTVEKMRADLGAATAAAAAAATSAKAATAAATAATAAANEATERSRVESAAAAATITAATAAADAAAAEATERGREESAVESRRVAAESASPSAAKRSPAKKRADERELSARSVVSKEEWSAALAVQRTNTAEAVAALADRLRGEASDGLAALRQDMVRRCRLSQ
jgi:hypothetical protein